MNPRLLIRLSRAKRLLSACLFALLPALGAQAAGAGDYTICIDPGHGGSDPGAMTQASFGCDIQSLAVNGALEEADVVLDISRHLRDYLVRGGFQDVFMTRDSDVYLTLPERTTYANSKGCDRFVSIHNNSSGTANTATGIETYCYSGNSLTSAACVQAQKIQDEMLTQWPIRDRGLKQAGFYVIKNTNMPATLTEAGFINNCSPDVNDYLSVAAKRKSAAKAHLYGLQAALGLPQIAIEDEEEVDVCAGQSEAGVRAPTRASAGSGSAMGVLFEDVGVGTSDMTNRIEGATVTLDDLSVTTDANGNWSFSKIAAGTYAIKGTAAGYESNSRTCTVPESGVIWCSFGLTRSSGGVDPDPEPEIEPDPEPGEVEPGVPVAITGTLVGGVYLAGTSTIVTPAYVTLNATNETALFCGDDWSFGELAAGTYTVTVTASGHETATYACPGVVAGQETRCDVSLSKTVGVDVAGGTGASIGEGLSQGTGMEDSGRDEASASDESGVAAGNGESDLTSGAPPMLSCSSAGTGGVTGTGLLAILACALFFLRRRSARRGATILLFGALTVGLSAPAQAAEVARRAVPATVTRAMKASPFVHVTGVATLIDGEDWAAPVLSPDGKSVAFTRAGMTGLYLMDVESGRVERLSQARNAGFAPRFSRDGKAIAYRVPGQPFHAMPQQVVDRKGKAVRPFRLHERSWVYQTKADAIVLREGRVEKVIAAPTTDKFHSPFLTPDGAWVIYSGLSTGVYGYRIADGATFAFGRGSSPSVSEDGRYLAFSQTADDGQEITRGVLHIADLRGASPRVCAVEMPGEIVLYPSISVSRSQVAFSNTDGQIRVARLRLP